MRGDAAWRACGHAPGHPAMPNACLFGANNLLFQKTLIFWEITRNLWARQRRPRQQPPMACSQGQGMLPRPCSSEGQGQGMQRRPRQPPQGTQRRPRHAAKAKAAPPWHAAKAKARSQGQGMQPRPRQPLMGMLPRQGHAAKARPRQPVMGKGHAAKARGGLASGGHGAKS